MQTPADSKDGSDVRDSFSTVEEANVANIIAKLTAGKVITRAEEERVRDYQEKKAAQEAAATARGALSNVPRVADSLKAAAAISGFPEEILSRAKAAGCPAFRGGRVEVDVLTEWMAENGDTLPTGNSELDAVNMELAKQKLRKSIHENEEREGLYLLKSALAPKVLVMGLRLKATLRKKLEEEYVDKLTMRTREEVLTLNRQLVDELCKQFQEGAAEWSKTS